MDGVFGSLDNIFPNATTADYCDLISWVMSNGLPSDMGGLLEGKLPSDLVPWLSGVLNPKRNQSPTRTDKNYDYYLDYQFNKKWDGGAQITTGLTYEHIRTFSGETEEVHQSDNVAAYMQYDQRFWDRLSVSAGVRAEYYRIDKHYREADTKVFGSKIPFRPVFRAGLNYQLADYSFLRTSFGQGYRNPSITEKYLRKDIGGVGVYPNYNVQPEKGFNAELGFKQGVQGRQFTRICRCRRFLYPIQGYGGIPVRPIQQCGPEHDKQRYRRHTNAEERQGFRHRGTVPQRVQSTDLWNGNQHQRHVHLQQKRQAAL